MKVLVVNTVPFELNGITSVIMNYFRAMDHTGIQMDFVAISEPLPEYERELKECGAGIFVLKRREGTLTYLRELIKLLKRGKYDVLHIHGNSALMTLELLPALLCGIKKRIVHSHSTSCTHMKLHKVCYPLFQLLATERLACGKEAGKWLFHDKKYKILQNGIDVRKFVFNQDIRNECRKEMGLEKQLLIGHVGNYTENKNQKFIVQLAEELVSAGNEVHFLLIGDGEYREKIEESVQEKNLGNYFTLIDRTMDVNKYMMAMDVFVLPSVYEGLPVVSVEAQAADVPCVFSAGVPAECDMTGTICFIDLQEKKKWIKTILNCKKDNRNSERNIKILTEKGFNIHYNAQKLKELYEFI